ncbi:MAG TPA: tetratricopeptide repeat protein [Terriglobales bacterium]|nr:tetratricopeptide repeat protein [Terriglobales bacterium]
MTVLLALMLWLSPQAAQTRPAATATATCMILPFENRSGNSQLDWMGESFVVSLTEALQGSPVTVLDRKSRIQALALAGVPDGTAISHATMIRMAQSADAHWLVAGWFNYDGTQLQVGAWLVDLPREHLVPMQVESGKLSDLETVQGHLNWSLLEQLAPSAAAAHVVNVALPLPAYESYVRGVEADTPAARVKYLSQAAKLAPASQRVWLALGEAELDAGDASAAANWLAKVPADSPDFAQAEFSNGVALYRARRYALAESKFADLAARLPLPEVNEDLAAAQAAQKLGAAPAELKTEFPVAGFEQLAAAVAQFDQAKLAALSPAQRADLELESGKQLQTAGAFSAAAKSFNAVIANPAASADAVRQAHERLAQIAARSGGGNR